MFSYKKNNTSNRASKANPLTINITCGTSNNIIKCTEICQNLSNEIESINHYQTYHACDNKHNYRDNIVLHRRQSDAYHNSL